MSTGRLLLRKGPTWCGCYTRSTAARVKGEECSASGRRGAGAERGRQTSAVPAVPVLQPMEDFGDKPRQGAQPVEVQPRVRRLH